MIYLIKWKGYFKIGYSKSKYSLKNRLKMYGSHLPEFEGFNDVIDGNVEYETKLHDIFWKWRTSKSTEWFFLTEESELLLDKYFTYKNPMPINRICVESPSGYLKKYYEDNPDKRESISRKLGGKPFLMYRDGTLVKKFLSISEAAKYLGVSCNSIQRFLYYKKVGKRGALKGITCSYLD